MSRLGIRPTAERRIKTGTSAEWAYENPVLKKGEPGYNETTGEFKLGNGIDPFSELDSISSSGGGGDSNTAGVHWYSDFASAMEDPIFSDLPSLPVGSLFVFPEDEPVATWDGAQLQPFPMAEPPPFDPGTINASSRIVAGDTITVPIVGMNINGALLFDLTDIDELEVTTGTTEEASTFTTLDGEPVGAVDVEFTIALVNASFADNPLWLGPTPIPLSVVSGINPTAEVPEGFVSFLGRRQYIGFVGFPQGVVLSTFDIPDPPVEVVSWALAGSNLAIYTRVVETGLS